MQNLKEFRLAIRKVRQPAYLRVSHSTAIGLTCPHSTFQVSTFSALEKFRQSNIFHSNCTTKPLESVQKSHFVDENWELILFGDYVTAARLALKKSKALRGLVRFPLRTPAPHRPTEFLPFLTRHASNDSFVHTKYFTVANRWDGKRDSRKRVYFMLRRHKSFLGKAKKSWNFIVFVRSIWADLMDL